MNVLVPGGRGFLGTHVCAALRGAISAMPRQALAGEPVVAYRGWARSFCFVRDAAEAVAVLVEHGERGEWDVGRDDDLRSLGWRPEVALEDGIRSTVEWLREAA